MHAIPQQTKATKAVCDTHWKAGGGGGGGDPHHGETRIRTANKLLTRMITRAREHREVDTHFFVHRANDVIAHEFQNLCFCV